MRPKISRRRSGGVDPSKIYSPRLVGRSRFAEKTPPHFAPNPRFIEGWHLADDPSRCATREYSADAGPENPRNFIFSPEVGKTLAGPNADRAVEPRDIEAVEQFGRGVLTIEGFQLAPAEDGCPEIQWLEFSVQVQGGY